ncbi:MAG: helix-turn-helix transcriptional regulator [Rhizobiaceae bacterium]
MRHDPANNLNLDYFDYIAEDLINCEGLEGVQHVLDGLLPKYGFENYVIFERDRYSKIGDHLSILLTNSSLVTHRPNTNQPDIQISDASAQVCTDADKFVEFIKSTTSPMHCPFVWVPGSSDQSATPASEISENDTAPNTIGEQQSRAIVMQCNPDKLRDYFFFFHGKQRFTTQTELAEIGYLVHLTSDLLAAEHAQNLRKSLVLGNRERQCLDWTAQGKTSFEISKILELSEHTVNNYIVSATRKLGASNRAHAIAKALRLDLI